MIKYIIILMNMLALIVVRLFFAGDVSVKVTAPEKVKTGDVITVSVTVNKGSISGVGFFKEELPAGFSEGTVVEAKSGDFKYLPQDNVIKFTWISLPSDPEFTISYTLKVSDAAANGNVAFGGKFSYVQDNQKQTVEVTPVTVQIGGGEMAAKTETPSNTTQPETTTTTQPDTTAAKQTETTSATTTSETSAGTNPVQNNTTESSSNISASRTIVGNPEAGMEFTVEVNIKKDGIKGFARVQEILPAGFTAMSLENQGGTFSFLDQKVKIIWDNLPADENIKVSYRVSVPESASGDMPISGTFSYVENNDPKKEIIPATTISVKPKSELANTTIPENNTTTTTTENPQTVQNNTTTENNQSTTASSSTSTVPAPEKNVTFKVQICALSKMQRGTSYFESKYNIGSKVSMELHEGWRKYIVGKYNKYQDARDYRESVRTKGVDSPFVTAYNNGKRVTVQEALMVSSQQWVR